jgi:hypothetical protein
VGLRLTKKGKITMQTSSHINVKFTLDGETFEAEHFDINFEQSVDFKGQPQHETSGGQMILHLSQTVTQNLYLWGKTSTLRKNGTILFQTDLGKTVLRIEFGNAYCISLTRTINALTGTSTVLIIAPETVKINDIEHDNFWTK